MGSRQRITALGIIRQGGCSREATRLAAVELAVLTYFMSSLLAEKSRGGTLVGYLDGFAAWLWGRGYSRATGYPYLRLVSKFSRWLTKKGIDVDDVDEENAKQFLRCRRRRRLHRGDWAALRLLLRYLRDAGILSSATRTVVHDERLALEQAFGMYLLTEKALSPATEQNYKMEIRAFLRHRFPRGLVTSPMICAHDLHRFVSWRAQYVAPRRVKVTVTALRAFCRFLHFRGDVVKDLTSSVLTVSNRRLATLPKSIPQDQVEQILAQCDQRTTLGRRNFAILLLLARLGLRAGEVVAVTLEDVDWEAGELLVRGKGSRRERLPLPHDVGKALAGYLRNGRPRCATRRFFVRAKAPLVGFSGPAAISTIVEDAIARAGLDPPSRGAHLLRYSLASHMLRRGSSLAEIAELLRHRHPDTTALYAKVDLNALSTVAPPWPGVRR